MRQSSVTALVVGNWEDLPLQRKNIRWENACSFPSAANRCPAAAQKLDTLTRHKSGHSQHILPKTMIPAKKIKFFDGIVHY